MRENLLKSSSSSSSHRETRPVNHQSKNIGCMSGIFHLVSKYHKRRKFLTSGEKQDKNVISSPARTVSNASVLENTTSLDCDFKKFSSDLKRSPTIPSDIRLPSSVKPPQISQSHPAVVAKLMGLNEIPSSPLPLSTAEKRRKLLEALEKCDEDLKSLKKIIESVRSADHVRSSTKEEVGVDCHVGGVKDLAQGQGQTSVIVIKQWSESKDRSSNSVISKDCFGGMNGGDSSKKEKRCLEVNSEQPSPVSVLDQISSSSSPSKDETGEKYRKLRECDISNLSFFHKITLETLPKLSGRRGDDDDEGKYLSSSMIGTMVTRTSWDSPFWSSDGKVESVNEVCKDAVWEQRWELGRIGVMLEDYMFGELIEETINELGCSYNMYSLPFEACKRRLCF